jgi:hypothetical protein
MWNAKQTEQSWRIERTGKAVGTGSGLRIEPNLGPGGRVSAGSEPQPIWMAALQATRCQAVTDGRQHAIRWEWVAGRAVYANIGADTELIQPLGVSVQGGHILAVHWAPGETAYTKETYRQAVFA